MSVSSMDRLSRSVPDAIGVVRQLKDSGTEFYVPDRNMVEITEKIIAVVLAFQLDTNSPSILPQLSISEPYAPRSYAGFGVFQSKKVKKVCDINLTHAGDGALCLASSLPT